jgi:Putative MetA-pathway of phenol degradation
VTARAIAAAALLAALAPAGRALAVSPLVVDDADTVERGRLQVNAGWLFRRAAPVTSHAILGNPVVGLSDRAELGATFGYQWLDGSGADAGAHGITDLLLASKVRLWRSAGDAFKAAARLDLRLPTASDERGLGTGNADAGVALIVTRCWGRTCLDANGGYAAVDVSSVVFGDDQYFLGLAARHRRGARWTVVGETYALLPHGGRASPAAVHFDVGVQLAATGELLLSILVGSALGRDSPALASYVGFTWVI